MSSPFRSLLSAARSTAERFAKSRAIALQRRRDHRRAMLDQVARSVGMDRVEHKGDVLTGCVDRHKLEIFAGRSVPNRAETRRTHRGFDEVRIALDSEGAIPETLALRPRGLFDPEHDQDVAARFLALSPEAPWQVEADEIQVPVEKLSACVAVFGDERTAYAILGEQARDAMKSAVGEYGVAVSQGVLSWEAHGELISADVLVAMIRRMVRLAELLTIGEEEIPVRLRRNVLHDPVALVRLACLDLLLAHYPQREETRFACRDSLHDGDVRVRLLAARSASEEAIACLKAIAASKTVPDAPRVEAIELLASRWPKDSQSTLLLALSSPSWAVQHAAVSALGHLEPTLVPVHDVEPILIELLNYGDLEVRCAAAEALASFGTPRAIAPLHAITRWFFTEAHLKSLAGAALLEIQGRTRNVERGQLAVVEDEQGRGSLSLEDREGALSVPDDPVD
jgi:hypothetical protein